MGDWQTMEDIAAYTQISPQAVHGQSKRAEQDKVVKRKTLVSGKPGRPTNTWALIDTPEVIDVIDQPLLLSTPHP